MRVILKPRLEHPDLGLDLDRLVGAHDGIGLLLPALFQRTAARLLGLEKFEIFAFLVVVGLNLVSQYVHVVDFQVFQDVGGKVVDLQVKGLTQLRGPLQSRSKSMTYVFGCAWVVLVSRLYAYAEGRKEGALKNRGEFKAAE